MSIIIGDGAEEVTRLDESLRGYLDLAGIGEHEIPSELDVENLLEMLDDFRVLGGQAYFRDGQITANLKIEGILNRYSIVKAMSSQKKAVLFRKILEYKENLNECDAVEYRLSLDRDDIDFDGRKILVYKKLEVGEIDSTDYDMLSTEKQRLGYEIFVTNGLGKYIGDIVKLALIKVFDTDIEQKKTLLHIVAPSNVGKTYFMKTLREFFPVANVELKEIFKDRSKVNVDELSRAAIWFQDEAGVLMNDFKRLAGSSVTIDKAYSKTSIDLVAPLVVMMSAENVQDAISEQFQNRLLKIEVEAENVENHLSGINIHELGVVSKKVAHDAIVTSIEEYRRMTLEEKLSYLDDITSKYRVKAESVSDIVRSMIDEMWDDFDQHEFNGVIAGKGNKPAGGEYILVKKRQFKKFIERVIDENADRISGKNLKYEALSQKPEAFGFREIDTTWNGQKIKGYIYTQTVVDMPVANPITPPAPPAYVA